MYGTSARIAGIGPKQTTNPASKNLIRARCVINVSRNAQRKSASSANIKARTDCWQRIIFKLREIFAVSGAMIISSPRSITWIYAIISNIDTSIEMSRHVIATICRSSVTTDKR
jgi:hypothetical protein